MDQHRSGAERAGAGGPSGRGSPFAYERLADELVEQIAHGTLRPGDRIPSVRGMSRRRGVSVSTVMQAYRVLEAARRIEARPKSGFYVLPHPGREAPPPPPSTPSAGPVAVESAELIAGIVRAVADADAVPLGAALPDPGFLPVRALARAMAGALRRDANGPAMHLSPEGVPALRRGIAAREWEAGRALPHDEVLVTCGVSEALDLALRASTRPGEVVAVESPTFFGVLQVIQALGRRALEIPTCPGEGMDLAALEEAVDRHPVRAIVVIPNFHNPLGSRMPDPKKEGLVRLATEHRIPLIEDDTFGELPFDGERPRSLRAWDGEDRVLRCGSFGKTLAPGYRLGWIVPGGRYRAAVRSAKLASTMGTSAPAQFAVARYLESGAYDRHLRRLRRTFRDTVRRLSAEVADRFPPGTRVSRPEGGFLLWVELPGEVDTLALHHRARSEGISICPGTIFSPSGGFRSSLRLSAGHPWSEGTERALDRLGRWAREG